MIERYGAIESKFISWVQNRGITVVSTGDLVTSLKLTPSQEARLLTQLSKKRLIAKLMRGLYLVPKTLPPGGVFIPSVYLVVDTLMKEVKATDSKTTRGERSKNAKPLKSKVAALPNILNDIRIEKALIGSNESMQYNATVSYDSVLIEKAETILVEISQREKIYEPVKKEVATLVQDPYSEDPLVVPFGVLCLSKGEAYAEKLRASLTRKTAAIRDLYDLDHAIKNDHIPFRNTQWLTLVKNKFLVPGNGSLQFSSDRKTEFKSQVETELRPVLRNRDFTTFDFENAWIQLVKMAELVKTLLE